MSKTSESQQLIFPFENRVAQGVEDFLVAPGNRHAVDWIDRSPDWPFTALVVAGPPGCGKSHLAALWRARTGAASIDLAETGIEQAAMLTLGGAPVLIEDCDRALADIRAERTLLQLYNLAKAADGRAAADGAPSPIGVAAGTGGPRVPPQQRDGRDRRSAGRRRCCGRSQSSCSPTARSPWGRKLSPIC